MFAANILFILTFLLISGGFYLLPQSLISPGFKPGIRLLFNIPSIVILILVPGFLCLINFSPLGFGRSLAAVFKRRNKAELPDCLRALAFFRIAIRYLLAVGILTTLIGLLMLLRPLTDPRTIAANVSSSLITTIYGLLAAGVIFNVFECPLARKIRGLSDESETRAELTTTRFLLALITGLAAIITFYLLYIQRLLN